MSDLSTKYPLFTACGSPALPSGITLEKFEEIFKRWSGEENLTIQTYLKNLSEDEQRQAIAFMVKMDEKMKTQPLDHYD
ncbi:MAG: hypothetical protein ACRCYZ_02595 [Alphaproteobacteria bacterium]